MAAQGGLASTRAALARRSPGGPVTLLGVDGCRAGWIVAEGAGAGARPRFRLFPTFAELLRALTAADALFCVDVPIGL